MFSRVTDPEYKLVQSKISTIWRRYTEFEQIHDYMQVTYPHVVIPPLPEKRVSKIFITTRSILFTIMQFDSTCYTRICMRTILVAKIAIFQMSIYILITNLTNNY